jgi:amidohydrolase
MSGDAPAALGLDSSPADAVFDDMVDRRRAVHRLPELAFAEHRSTELIRDHMAGLGIDEARRVTETGGIYALDGGRPGRTVVLRADIDALPVQEDPTRRGCSEVEGIMHACGHDVHVAALLGAATVLASRQEDLPGRFLFVFQPGEEALGGAKKMVEGGALELMTGARLTGFHATSQLPTGMVGLREGVAMSEAHSLRVTLSGPGGHAASPTGQGDVVQAAADLVRRLAGVVEGLTFEGSSCICSAGTLSAGTAVNVVPTEARVTGTLRTFTAAQREDALGRLRLLCDEVAKSHVVEVDLALPEHTPAVENDPAVTALVEAQAKATLGADQVLRIPPTSPSDDVSEFLKRIPGCYFFVGGASPDGSCGPHHSPRFAVEDEALRVGANVMVRSALVLASP